ALKALAPAEVKRPLPEPELRVLAGGEELRPDERGHLLVRTRRPELRLFLGRYEPPPGDRIVRHPDGGAARGFAGPAVKARSARVDLPDGKERVHHVEAVVTLPEYRETPQRSARLTLRYQPPAPALEYRGSQTQTVQKKEFALKVGLKPGADGLGMRVTI